MKKVSFPITAAGISFADRQAVFRYVINTFSMYYDAVDVVRENANDALIISTTENEPWFNFCIHKDGDPADCIARNRPLFAEFKRDPLLYISPASSCYGSEIALERFADDAFMFLEDESILENYRAPDSVKVELTEDEETFIKVWGDARRDPNDIYGAASAQMINGMRCFFQTPPDGFNHFATMAYQGGKAAANVVSVYTRDFLLVVGLGTLPEFRKRGLGTALMKDIMERARALGIRAVTLQTEAGTYNEKYYEKMGFITKFNGIYYKPSIIDD
jgi:GNAT superfamily N-acetyltransferase